MLFSYDPLLAVAVKTVPQSIPELLQVQQTIDAMCVPGDGLKWFNLLYLTMTRAVENRVAAGGFNDPLWLAELDVQFVAL